jgi:hypothetical protein
LKPRLSSSVTTIIRSIDGPDRESHTMKANELRVRRAHPSASRIRVGEVRTVPSYLQRYAAELEAWHAQRRAAAAQKA